MRISRTTTIRGFTFLVIGEYTPGIEGRETERNGDPGYPASPPELNISAVFADGDRSHDMAPYLGDMHLYENGKDALDEIQDSVLADMARDRGPF